MLPRSGRPLAVPLQLIPNPTVIHLSGADIVVDVISHRKQHWCVMRLGWVIGLPGACGDKSSGCGLRAVFHDAEHEPRGFVLPRCACNMAQLYSFASALLSTGSASVQTGEL